MTRRLFWFLVPGSLSFLVSTAIAQDRTDDPGMMAFNNACRTCHTIREGDNRLGPNLYAIIGRKSGTTSGYHNYSSSMQNADIVWDEKNLEQFITKTEAVVSGNNMKPFSGVGSADVRTKIVNFLKTCALCGPSCPAPRMCSRR